MITAAGVPRLGEYGDCVGSPLFSAMEAASRAFLDANSSALSDYARRWAPDPLHQWSRQWEYPFVFERLLEQAAGRPTPEILDAGSGLTFFPFHVASGLPGARVTCCDQDAALAPAFERLAHPLRSSVTFATASLQALPFPDRSFDAVYSISVLEHTGDHRRVLGELRRVLRPGGGLVVTFDVSLDGRCDIDPGGARALLADMESDFERVEGPAPDGLDSLLRRPDTLTTGRVRTTHPELLPWRRSLGQDIATLLRFRWPRTPFFECAVCGVTYRRPGA